MPNTSKSSKKSSPANGGAAKPEFADVFTPLYLNGVESLAELQKNCLDVAAQQAAEWMGAWKKAVSYFPVPVPMFVFDVAEQGVQTCVATHKDAINLVVEQNQAVAKITKERVDAYSKIAGVVTEALQNSVQRSLEAQNKFLEFAAEQSQSVCAAAKKQVGSGPAAMAVETLGRGVKTAIGAQKSILDAATKPFVIPVN